MHKEIRCLKHAFNLKVKLDRAGFTISKKACRKIQQARKIKI